MAASRERFKTYKGVFDAFTLRTLFALASQGHFEELKSPLSIGKESSVFAAEKDDGSLIAVKIYRLETCDFNRMYDYINGDPRFSGLLKNRRKIIFAWAQREYRNLLLAREGLVSSPFPITVKNNVLLEEFIGGGDPAPRLNNQPPDDAAAFFDLLVLNLQRLHRIGLTHGDLSPFNILNNREHPVLIDFSQATVKRSPSFDRLFHRDISTICAAFGKFGLEPDTQTVINRITAGGTYG